MQCDNVSSIANMLTMIKALRNLLSSIVFSLVFLHICHYCPSDQEQECSPNYENYCTGNNYAKNDCIPGIHFSVLFLGVDILLNKHNNRNNQRYN